MVPSVGGGVLVGEMTVVDSFISISREDEVVSDEVGTMVSVLDLKHMLES